MYNICSACMRGPTRWAERARKVLSRWSTSGTSMNLMLNLLKRTKWGPWWAQRWSWKFMAMLKKKHANCMNVKCHGKVCKVNEYACPSYAPAAVSLRNCSCEFFLSLFESYPSFLQATGTHYVILDRPPRNNHFADFFHEFAKETPQRWLSNPIQAILPSVPRDLKLHILHKETVKELHNILRRW